jgi:voltage-gated potassium channel
MILLRQVGTGLVLVVLTLCLQCAGVAALINWLRGIVTERLPTLRRLHSAALVMQTTIGIILMHGTVILLWATCYRSIYFASWESAFYFSASSYTTVGYGDVVLPLRWRLLGPLESMVGMLMSGISVGLLFAIITHLIEVKSRISLPLRPEPAKADQVFQ